MLLKVYKSRVWLMLLMLLPFVGSAQAQVSPWDFTENPTSAVYAITTSVVFDGVDALAPGDWVGAFYMNDGVLECAGAAEWIGTANTAVVAFGNDTLEAPNKVGFSEGEMVHWKLYYSATGTETEVLSTPEFFWTNGAMGEVTSFYVEETGCEQNLSMVSGWNWISFNVLPEDTELNAVLGVDGFTEGDFIQTIGGTADFYEGFGWFGTLSTIDSDQGYQIRLNSPNSLTVNGLCVDVADPISLASGWSWIGYKPQNAGDINVVLGSLTPSANDFIQTIGATADYYEGFGWFGTLESLTPGKGYQIRMANDDQLIYPEVDQVYQSSAQNTNASVKQANKMGRENPNWPTPPGFPFYQTIKYQVLLNGVPIETAGSKLSAWKDDEIRGLQGVLVPPPILGGPHYPIQIGSEVASEPGITFKFYDVGTDQVYDILETIDFESGNNYGTPSNPVVIHCIVDETINICGTVTDEITLEPIEGATITATGSGGGQVGNPNWPTPPGFPFYQTIKYQVLRDGMPVETPGSKLSAWKDDEIRGLQGVLVPPPILGGPHYPIQIGSEVAAEPGITFKFYDAGTDMVYDIEEGIDFVSGNNYGTPSNPVIIHVILGGSEYSTTTGADGTYCINDVEAGTYTIGAEAEGYIGEEVEDVLVEASITQDFALVPEITCEDVVINNFPEAPADLCAGEELSIDFNGVEVLNAVSVEWTVDPVEAGVFDGLVFNLDTEYAGMVTITVFGEAAPPCEDATMTLAFEVFPLPEVTCPVIDPVCAESGFFTFPAVVGGVYTDAEANVVTGFDPVEAGTFVFTLTVTDDNGCSASCEFNVVVNPLPEIDCPEYAPVCVNSGEIVFPEVAGGWYQNEDGDEVTFFDPTEAGNFLFALNVTNEFGCEDYCIFEIVVNPLPVVECPEFEVVCEDSDVIEFPVVGGGVYTNEAGDVVTEFDPVEAGFYAFTLTVTDENGCEGFCEFEIEVMALPIPYAGPDAAIGTEDTYTLADAAIENIEEGDFWWWETSGDGAFMPDVFALNATYVPGEGDIADGNVELCLYVNSFMCGVDVVDCMTLSIDTTGGCINPPTAFAGEDMVVCADGEAVQLEGSVEYAELFFWSTLTGSGEFSDEYSLNPIYTPGEGDYFMGSVELCLTAIGSEGCPDAVDCMTITFNPLPEVTLMAYEPVCQGSEAFDLYGGMPAGGTYFVDGLEAASFNPEMAGEYDLMYTYTDENGCSNSAMGTIVVLELPEVTLMAYAPVCEGSEAFDLYGGLPEGGTYFVDYVPAVTFNPEMAGQYDLMYMYTDENGCTNFATGIILVNPLPVVECPVFAPVCEGSEMIEFDEVEGGVYTDANGVVTGFDPAVAGTYEFMLEVTNDFGCSDNCTFTIVVNPLPYLIYEPAVFTMCLGEEIDVTITGPADGAYPYAVEFMINGELMTDVIDGSINVYQLEPEMAGTWSLEVISVTDANGCVAAENSAFEVEVLPLTAITTQPVDVLVVYGQPFELTVVAENATGYQWYFEGAMIAGANTDTYTVEAAMLADGGTYYVMVFGECGDVMSAEVTVTITPETQTIDFLGSVNGMSTYLELIEDDMATILAPVLSDLYYVEMKNPAMVWTPSNTSFDFNENKGAKVILNSGWPTSVEVEGFPTLGASVNLPAGSSYLPVRSRDVVSAADVFEPLGASLFAVFSLDYSGIYWPSYNVFTLQNLIPGSAYLIVMNEPAIADFDVLPAKAAVAKYVNVPANMTSWNDMVLTATQHNIAITADALQGLQIGDVIGAFNEYGQIAGMIEVTNLRDDLVLRAFGDNPATEAVEGFVEGDLITFKVWRNGVEIAAEATFTSDMPNQNVFAKDGISAVEGLKAGVTAIDDLSTGFTANLYPNPATDVVNINTNFVISNIKVINYVGQVIFENNPEQEDFQINTSNLVSGMYFVQIESNEGYVITKRLTIK